MGITEVPVKKDRDYLDFVADEEEEWDLIRDLEAERKLEECYTVSIKDLKTGKIVWWADTDQFTMNQEFDIDTGYDVMTLKINLSENYLVLNGDEEFLGE